MDTTSEVKPSCSNCIHKSEGGLNDVPPLCWDCTSYKTLVHFEPKPTFKGLLEATFPSYAKQPIAPRRIQVDPDTKKPLDPLDYAKLHGATPSVSDGSTASYYELPEGAEELQDLIGHRNMNAQIGEIFRECYRYGKASHCNELRGIKKILFYANAEKKRLERLLVNVNS